MNIPHEAIEAVARVFYEFQTGADNLDTSTYRAAWIRIAEQALEPAAPHIASRAWIECAQWHEERLVRDGVPPLFDAAVYANPYQEVAK